MSSNLHCKYKFSLVLSTINRLSEVRRFFESLEKQESSPSFEVIIVDQNKDGRLDALVEEYRKIFNIKRIHLSPGLAKARNAGMRLAEGEITAFPDDDCEYPPSLLCSMASIFDSDAGCDGVSTLVTDRAGNYSAGGYMGRTPHVINHKNIWRSAVSPSIFIRTSSNCASFDETLGVGSGTPYGSGEESDYILNLCEQAKKICYRPELVVWHPRYEGIWDTERAYLYGCGMGRVLKKHKPHFHFYSALYFAALQTARAFQSLLFFEFRKSLYHLAMARGRLDGYFKE